MSTVEPDALRRRSMKAGKLTGGKAAAAGGLGATVEAVDMIESVMYSTPYGPM